MKTIIRNFFSTLRRFKTATLLNVLGLSISFATFIAIMMQVSYDLRFDKFHKNVECIYRLGVYHQNHGNTVVISRPLIDAFIASSPHIKKGALITSWDNNAFFSIEKNGNREGYQEFKRYIYPDFATIFDFEMIEGEKNATEIPQTVLIPQSMAKKMFGDESAIGKQLTGEGWENTIGGVYKDFPDNTVVKNIIYQSISKEENLSNWRGHNYHLYLLLESPEAKDELIPNFLANFKDAHQMGWETMDLRLTWLPDIYYETDAQYDSQKEKGSRTMVLLLFTIALLIVLIAGINFTNFTNATVPMRVKSINTQKILGGSDRVLRWSLLAEALVICLISFGLSLIWLNYASQTWLGEMVNADMRLKVNIPLIVISGILAVLVGFLSGLYPAYYVTSFPPALALKGSYGLSPSGRRFRNILISIQFTASFALIIAALFIFLQNKYMQTSSLGFNTDQVVMIPTNKNIRQNTNLLTERLKNESCIQDVSYSEWLLASSDYYSGWGAKYHDKDIQFTALNIAPNLLKILDIPLIAGRDFREDDIRIPGGVYIFNETARNSYGLEIGGSISDVWITPDPGTIIGFVDDIRFASFRNSVTPMAFYVTSENKFSANYAYVRINAGSNIQEAVRTIKHAFADIAPNYEPEVIFYDTVLNNLYKKERNTGMLISLFSLIVVFISIVGIFGMVLFESEFKRKEVSLRKVHGASIIEIMQQFNKTYLRILVVCFIFAAPIAYYAIFRWLENFAYKTPMYWWVFVSAFLFVTILTSATVTFQSWRVANANPVDSIKTE